MKKVIYIIVSMLLFINSNAQLSIKWQKSYGGSGDDHVADDANYYDSPDHCIARTSDGGFAITGFTDSNNGLFPLNQGSSDYAIVKCDSLGNVEWSNSYGGSQYEQATSIIQTHDGGYAIVGWSFSDTGTTWQNYGSSDVLIVKVNASGVMEWAKNYGGTDEEKAYSIAETADHGLVVGAFSRSSDSDVTTHVGGSDIWLFKTDSTGTLLWNRTYGGTFTEWLNAMSPTSDNGFVLCCFSNSFDTDVSANNGLFDYWIVKVDSLGILEWEKNFGGTGNDWTTDIVQSRDGGYAICGMSESNDGDVTGAHGGHDCWMVKISSTGAFEWQKDVGGSLIDEPYEIIQTADDGFFIAGTTNSTDGDVQGIHGLLDYFLIKLDDSGNLSWQKTFGGTDSEWAISVIEKSPGSYLVNGNSRSSNFDVTVNNGGWDFWVVEFTTSYNTIKGQYYVDANLNSTFDTGDFPVPHKLISDTIHSAYAFTDANGFYNVNVADSGDFEIYPAPLNNHTVAPPSYSVNFPGFNSTDSLKDFIATPIPGLNDLQISIVPLTRFRPGFNVTYLVNYSNVGTTVLTGSVTMILDSALQFDSASVAPDVINGDTLIWNNIPLAVWQSGSIYVYTTLDFSAGFGDHITSSVMIEDGAGITDENREDNYSSWTGEVTGSFDPNDKAVSVDKIYTDQLPDLPYLNYVIRFQNTGNDTALTVVIRDTLSSGLDINSFEFVNSSHAVTPELNAHNNLLTFTFSNILLADSNTNEAASHGFVHFRIKPKQNIAVNDVIENTAGIYFDFNPPVITNTVTTLYLLPNRVGEVYSLNAVIYPNPANELLKIILDSKKSNLAKEIEIYNSTGQLLLSKNEKAGSNKIELSLSDLNPGIYLIKIKAGGEEITKRFIRN